MVQLKDIVKIYNKGKSNEFEALHGVSAEIKDGEMIAIVGTSGAGKSTLLHILGFIDRYDKGEYILDGTPVGKMNEIKMAHLRNEKIGMIMQDFALIEDYTVQDNVLIPLDFSKKKMRKKEKLNRVISALEAVGMKEHCHKPVKQLSGGQKQRVAIARALATNPKILLCDEATSALDPTTTKAILALLKEINQKYGITIVIITHEMAVVQEIGTHVAIIDHGELAESGTVEEVFTHPKSKAARKLVLMDDDNHYDEMKGQHCIRIVFKSNSSFEPVIANMVLAHRMPVNILLADTKDINGVAHGQMILQLPEDTTVAQKMIQYLKDRNLEVEELDHYVG